MYMYITSFLSHLFIPQSSNNHKAKLLHPSVLSLISLSLFVVQIGIRTTSFSQPAVLGDSANISPAEVIRLTNEKRANAGLPALTYNQALAQAAKEKGENMLANDYWAHVGPDGTQPWYFFAKYNYKYRYAGENLARDFTSASSVVDAWMASQSHRENMLSPKYKDIGIAVVEGDLGGSNVTLVVEFLGTKMSDSGKPIPIAQAKTEVSPTKAPVAMVITETPTSTPTPTETPQVVQQFVSVGSQQLIEAQSSEPSYVASLFSPYEITRTISLSILILLFFVTILDAAVVARRRIPRVTGKAFAHLAFFGMIIAVILIVQAGKIL